MDEHTRYNWKNGTCWWLSHQATLSRQVSPLYFDIIFPQFVMALPYYYGAYLWHQPPPIHPYPTLATWLWQAWNPSQVRVHVRVVQQVRVNRNVHHPRDHTLRTYFLPLQGEIWRFVDWFNYIDDRANHLYFWRSILPPQVILREPDDICLVTLLSDKQMTTPFQTLTTMSRLMSKSALLLFSSIPWSTDAIKNSDMLSHSLQKELELEVSLDHK